MRDPVSSRPSRNWLHLTYPGLMEQASHDRYRAALSALLDGEEPSMGIGSTVAHLSRCPGCSAWLDSAARVNAGMRELPVVPPALGEQVVDRVDVCLCACVTGGRCLCGNCQCGPTCTCGTDADAN